MKKISNARRLRQAPTTVGAAVCSILLMGGAAQAETTRISGAEQIALERLESQASFRIPPQPIATALVEFSKQAKLQLVTASVELGPHQTSGVSGKLSLREALDALLERSGLSYAMVGENTVAIVASDAEATTRMSRTSYARVAQADTTAATTGESSGEEVPAQMIGAAEGAALEEVVVTGSHIRGVQNLSSPVITFDREDIEKGGFATTQQLIQSLPQNLNSISDSTFGSGNGGSSQAYTYDASGVNLRGLGGSSTLVLLNGRRMAAVGDGSVVDISLIPVGAIERMEVLADGASAIYGSDAVGGVVNVVLRTDFEGAETRVRYGSVTEGSQDEVQAGQMFGRSWGSGQALLSYDYYDRSPLNAEDRDFIDFPSYEPIPKLKRHSALATVTQRLSERVQLSGDVFFGQRASGTSYLAGGLNVLDIDVRQFGGGLTLSGDLPGRWQARLSGVTDESRSEMAVDYVDYDLTVDYANRMRLVTVDLSADGPLAALPGGEIRLGIGGQFRAERFDDVGDDAPMAAERDIRAAYAELNIPVIGPANRRAGIQRMELTLASRYEDYSDFGSTFNPKLGISWAPVKSLNIRGTWGTSFKAPLLSSMNAGGMRVIVREAGIVDESGPVSLLEVVGSGVNLQPEEAETWTAGFDWIPSALRGLELATTYFSISYEDRIQTPIPLEETLEGIVRNPLYSPIVTRNPDLAYVQSFYQLQHVLCDGASMNVCVSPEQIQLIVDGRLRNVASTYMSGLDFSVTQGWDNAVGTWSAQLTGTYLLMNDAQLIARAPRKDQLNQVWYPVDLRLRGGLSFTRDALSVNAFVNYVNDYRDSRTGYVGEGQRSSVGSWTTADLTFQYELQRAANWLGFSGAKLALSVTNILDRDPPYVASYYNIHFDGANASAQGRFVALQISTQW